MKRHKQGVVALMVALMVVLTAGLAGAVDFSLDMASYLGGTGGDTVRGMEVLADGSIFVGAVVGGEAPEGAVAGVWEAPGADGETFYPGLLLHLSKDGSSLLWGERVDFEIWDMCEGGEGFVYIAAGNKGVIKFDTAKHEVVWSQSEALSCHRVDASHNGIVAALHNSWDSSGLLPTDLGRVRVYDADGELLAQVPSTGRAADVAINERTEDVIIIGYREVSSSRIVNVGPIYQMMSWRILSSLLGVSLPDSSSYRDSVKEKSGTREYELSDAYLWTAYNWTGEQMVAEGLGNARPVRGCFGRDGKLHVLAIVDDEDHAMMRDPQDISSTISLPGIDDYHSFKNAGDEDKVFIGTYDADTGALIAGQQFCARGTYSPARTTIAPGDIEADADGRVYIVGDASVGLPWDDGHDDWYAGGPFLLVMDEGLDARLDLTRVCGQGTSFCVDVATVSGASASQVLYGGQYKNTYDAPEVTVTGAIQEEPASDFTGQLDGFMAMYAGPAETKAPILAAPPDDETTEETTGETTDEEAEVAILITDADLAGADTLEVKVEVTGAVPDGADLYVAVDYEGYLLFAPTFGLDVAPFAADPAAGTKTVLYLPEATAYLPKMTYTWYAALLTPSIELKSNLASATMTIR